MFEVQTRFVDKWENCWHVDDVLEYFTTRAAAKAELKEHLAELKDAGMDYNSKDFRIQKCEAVIKPARTVWTVLLLRPDYLANEFGTDTYLAWVKAPDATEAVRTAQRQAAETATEDDVVDEDKIKQEAIDHHPLIVLKGRHHDLTPGEWQ